MPTLEENRGAWAGYDWKQGGDEWSEVWGGAAFQWWGALFPRIYSFLPAGTVLEIAPGYGRWTQFVAPLCRSLILVDVTERCIAACRERFKGYSHIAYHVNDGRTLPPIRDGSIDFAFSFDSFVHLETDVVDAYLRQIARTLAPEGVGFIHHSNAGAFLNPSTGELSIENVHWRATSMSAARFAELCAGAGLACIAQEVVNWGGPDLNDCFSAFARAGSKWSEVPPRRTENPSFMVEAQGVRRIADAWGPVHERRAAAAGRTGASWLSRSMRRLGFR